MLDLLFIFVLWQLEQYANLRKQDSWSLVIVEEAAKGLQTRKPYISTNVVKCIKSSQLYKIAL